MTKGWKKEPKRHSLASKGIKTKHIKGKKYYLIPSNVTNKQWLYGDFDKDGVKNKDDCYPLDPERQHRRVPIWLTTPYKNEWKSHESNAWIPKDEEQMQIDTSLLPTQSDFDENVKKLNVNTTKESEESGFILKNGDKYTPYEPPIHPRITKPYYHSKGLNAEVVDEDWEPIINIMEDTGIISYEYTSSEDLKRKTKELEEEHNIKKDYPPESIMRIVLSDKKPTKKQINGLTKYVREKNPDRLHILKVSDSWDWSGWSAPEEDPDDYVGIKKRGLTDKKEKIVSEVEYKNPRPLRIQTFVANNYK